MQERKFSLGAVRPPCGQKAMGDANTPRMPIGPRTQCLLFALPSDPWVRVFFCEHFEVILDFVN